MQKARVLVFGECHVSQLTNNSKLKIPIFDILQLINISHGNGNLDCLAQLLEIQEFSSNDIFLLGGTAHDKIGSEESYLKKINKTIDLIFSKYRNSKIVFLNCISKSTHSPYQQILKINSIKRSLVNNLNIFCIDIPHNDHSFIDNSHFNNQGKEIFQNEIISFFNNNVSKLLNTRYSVINPENNMTFDKNDSVTFVLNYKKHIPSTIKITYYNQITSQLNHHVGKNVTPNRPNIIKLPNLKNIEFDSNIEVLHCCIKRY